MQFSFENLFQTIGQMGLDAFQGLAQGFGQMVSNWVLTGDAGGNSLRKLFAGLLAQVAQVATTYAIMCLAAAAFATTGFGAVLMGGSPHQFLIAAAIFGGIAATAAIAGRAVAGSAFTQQKTTASSSFAAQTSSGSNSTANQTGGGSGQGGNYYSSHSDTNIREEDRLRTIGTQKPTEVVEHRIDLTQANGQRREFVIKTLKEDNRLKGDIREMIKTMVEAIV